jgi:hypothetical protein
LASNFLKNFESRVEELLNAYKFIDGKMLLKISFLDSHLDVFPTNLSDGGENGEYIRDGKAIPGQVELLHFG